MNAIPDIEAPPKFKLTRGHKIDFVSNGEVLKRMEESIEKTQAGDTIVLKAFLWRADETGKDMARLLLQKANEGVKIYIFKDQIGAFFEFFEGKGKSMFHSADDEGLQSVKLQSDLMRHFYHNVLEPELGFSSMNPLFTGEDEDILKLRELMTNHKHIHFIDGKRYDHSKIFIIDGKDIQTAFVGGVGFGDEFKEKWPDGAFQINDTNLFIDLIKKLGGQEPDKNNGVFFATNRLGEKNPYYKEISTIIKGTKHKIELGISYLGNPKYIRDLAKLLKEGKNVIMTLSQQPNINRDRNLHFLYELVHKLENIFLYLLSFGFEKKVPENLQIFLPPSMVHLKILIRDNNFASLGSANLSMGASIVKIPGTKALVNECNVIVDAQEHQEWEYLIQEMSSFLSTLRDNTESLTSLNMKFTGRKELGDVNFWLSRMEYIAEYIQRIMISLIRRNEIKKEQKREMEKIKDIFPQYFGIPKSVSVEENIPK